MQKGFCLFFLTYTLLLSGCIRGYDLTIDYRNRFVERVKSFDHKRAQIKSSFHIVFETLEMKLQSPEPNFRSIAWEWESRISSLEHKIDNLQEELVKMDTLAKFFYKQLTDMNAKLKDSTIRKRERVANQEHESDWKKLRAYAKRNMDRARKAISMGRDAHKVFVASGIRTKREDAIKTMHEVRGALFGSMRRLERFARATDLLMSMEQEGIIPKEIEKMEERREDVVERLNEISKTIERQLLTKGRELQEISWKWESKYADMRYDLEALADDFENLKGLTTSYYGKSLQHIEKIVNPQIRAEEEEVQKMHQAKLDRIYDKIEKIKDKIIQNFRFSDDTYQVLINAARRRQIDKAVEGLREIRTKIANSLIDLRDTLKELKDLFTAKPLKNTPKKPKSIL